MMIGKQPLEPLNYKAKTLINSSNTKQTHMRRNLIEEIPRIGD